MTTHNVVSINEFARSRALLNNPRESLKRHATQPNYTDKWQVRNGSELTPQVLTSVFNAGDLGFKYQEADILDEIRETDPHLQSVLFKREVQVAGAHWELTHARRTRKTKKRDKVLDFCTDALQSFDLARMVADLQGAVFHGRSVSELVWCTNGRYIQVEEAFDVHPRRINFAANNFLAHIWDNFGGTDYSKFPGVPVSAFPFGKLITHTPRVRGGYVTREGLGRVVSWYSLFKRWTMRDWMALAEMVGRPGRVGYYGTGTREDMKSAGGEVDVMTEASANDISLLQDALDSWSSSVSVALPDTVRMKFTPSGTSHNSLHKELKDDCNSEISKAVCGETLTTDAGSKGARALGDVHDDQRLMMARWDARCIAWTLRKYLLKPLVQLNFGEGVEVPEIQINVMPSDDLDKIAARLKTLREAGMRIPATYARDIANIEDPIGDEECLGDVPQTSPKKQGLQDTTSSNLKPKPANTDESNDVDPNTDESNPNSAS